MIIIYYILFYDFVTNYKMKEINMIKYDNYIYTPFVKTKYYFDIDGIIIFIITFFMMVWCIYECMNEDPYFKPWH